LQSDKESEAIVKNETFQRALQACSVEAVCFAYEIKQVTFQQILQTCEVSAFDVWKIICRWVELELSLPYSLGVHLRGLCRRVVTTLAWSEESVFDALLKSVDSPSARVFSRKLLSESALRISELCGELPESVSEEIWSSVKTVLSEHTELLRNRHLDQVLLCTIYGASKALLQPVTFNSLISKYTELYPHNSVLFRSVLMDSGTTCDIIAFYNEVFVVRMQAHLLTLNRPQGPPQPPRVPSLYPPSPLRMSLPQSQVHFLTSPAVKGSPSSFLSPRSSTIYAFGESPSNTLDGINRLMQKSERCINFDAEDSRYPPPRKRSKHLDHIFEEDSEAMPTFPEFEEPEEFE
jgi:retinoblastoma-associated protein